MAVLLALALLLLAPLGALAEQMPDGSGVGPGWKHARFSAMPRGYQLSQNQMQAKRALEPALKDLQTRQEGRDYASGEIVYLAGSEAEAKAIADAYGASLKQFSAGVAVAALRGATVFEAVTAAANPSSPLPPVYPNIQYFLYPEVKSGSASRASARAFSQTAPTLQTWANSRPDDPFLQDPSKDEYQYMHDVVSSYAAWGTTKGSASVKVAVLDSGVDATHPELSGKVTPLESSIAGEPDSGVDTVGHGTFVAGIIAAKSGNAQGGSGVAPGVSVLSVKVLGKDGGDTAGVVAGHRRAVAAGANLINMSLGSIGYDALYEQAIDEAFDQGIATIAAVGNDGTNIINYPAGCANAVAVAATDATGYRAFDSNYGSWVDLCAPGSAINSTFKDQGYAIGNGTSGASAVVTGASALYISAFGAPGDAAGVKAMVKALQKSAIKARSSQVGAGIVNIGNLFGQRVAAPALEVRVGGVKVDAKRPVSIKGQVAIAPADADAYVLYTVDGKTPSVKGGQVVEGEEYSAPIELSDYKRGKHVVRAMTVNKNGIASKVATLTVTTTADQAPTAVGIDLPDYLAGGKSMALKASVAPLNQTSQSVVWSVVSGAKLVSFSAKKATLTARKGASGQVVVRATAKANSAVYAEHTIEIVPYPVDRLTLKPSGSTTLNTQGNATVLLTLSGRYVNKAPLDLQKLNVAWSSSNARVATVDQTGLVTAEGKGSAYVYARALDGSGKSVKCAVRVNKNVANVQISGPEAVASGKTATLKAIVSPSDASTSSVRWSIVSAPQGVKISSKGVVAVPRAVTSGTIRVKAQSADSVTAQSATHDIEVRNSPIKSLALSTADGRATYSKNKLYAAQIYAMNIPKTQEDDSIIQLGYTGTLHDGSPVVGDVSWKSSNKAVAVVDQSGKVQAVGAGKATISCAATDGSGVKASMTVNVIVPVSSISVTTSALRMQYDVASLQTGKSMRFAAKCASTFGKPTNTRVKWSIALVCPIVGGDPDVTQSLTSYFAKKIKISSSGVLSVSSAVARDIMSLEMPLRVIVRATTTDGTNMGATLGVDVSLPTRVLKAAGRSSMAMPKNTIGDEYILGFFTDSLFDDFTISSSNPSVANVAFVTLQDGSEGYYFVADETSRGIVYGFFVQSGNRAGTATIKVKDNSGSGKSCSFKVKVK